MPSGTKFPAVPSRVTGLDSPGGPAADLLASHLRDPNGLTIQDGAVIHATDELETVIGDWVVVGHLAHIEGATVANRTLIGVGSVVLHRVVVGEGATVGAGAVLTNGMEVPPGALAVGVPAQIKLGRSDARSIERGAKVYVDNCVRYRAGLRRLDPPR